MFPPDLHLALLPCTMPTVPKPEPTEAETLALLTEAQRLLQARRKNLANQLASIDGTLVELDRLIGQLVNPRRNASATKPGPQSVIKPAIEEILRAAQGEALHADQILEGVRAKGISVSKRDPKATIVTALLRMHRQRMAEGSKTGVEKLGGNRFRWIQDDSDSPSEPQPLSVLFPGALLALASQHEHVGP